MAGPRKFSRKVCPNCSNQCAVASKKCLCGFLFYSQKIQSPSPEKMNEDFEEYTPVKSEPGPSPDLAAKQSEATSIRRTERVRRERPNFYDASEFISEKKLKRQLQQQEEKEQRVQQKSPVKTRKRRGRKPRVVEQPPAYPDEIAVGPFGKLIVIDDEPLPEIGEEKQWQFSVILDDLSRKLIANNPKF